MDVIEPTTIGTIDRDGIATAWETYGSGDVALAFPPTFNIVHSRLWKSQVPWLARHARLFFVDPLGNGRSDRPTDPDVFDHFAVAGDVVAALDAAGVDRVVLVGSSFGSLYSALVATMIPDRIAGILHIGTGMNLSGDFTDPLSQALLRFEEHLDSDEGWASFNRWAFERDWPASADFFIRQAMNDAHSGRPIEDGIDWSLEADPGSTAAMMVNASRGYNEETLGMLKTVVAGLTCPQAVIHGTDDHICHYRWGQVLAEVTAAPLYTVEGGGHCPQVRFPALINGIILNFANQAFGVPEQARPKAKAASSSGPRVLYLSSPIGLGHARRDLAVADELRAIAPDVHIDWLAQDPVTRFLDLHGEAVHPMSAELAGESAFLERQAGEHDLFVFEAIREMDTILVNNFGVFNDVVDDEPYDLVIGDESWEVDLFLHEHPKLKKTRFAWFTDFVGYLPMPAGGARDEWFAADYNAWSIENIERHPDVRDLALFVGEPDDVIEASFGPGLPDIDDWVMDHYEFCGYVVGNDPSEFGDLAEIRAELGWRDDETVVVAAVGGSAVGTPLLERIIAAHPLAAEAIDGLRTVVVTGPRIDPASLPETPGVDKVAFVPDLNRWLAAADLGVVQGGLTTTMELVAANRPFLYFPLRNHFEQQYHVRHRLDRHRAGIALDYATATPEVIATEIANAVGKTTNYVPVPTDGARRAAKALSALL